MAVSLTSLTLSWPSHGATEHSESSPEPPSPSSSRPPASSPSPSPSLEAVPPLPGHTHEGRGQTGPGGGASEHPQQPQPNGNLDLKEEEVSPRPHVPYSTLSPDSEDGHGPVGSRDALRGVALPALQAPLALVLVLRLPWVVGTGGIVQACAIAVIMAACTVLTSVSLSAVATNSPEPGGCLLGLLSGALGPEAGGAVGVCAFLSDAFTAAAAALGGAEVLLVYVAPGAAVLPGRGRAGRLNNGRGYGAALLALLALVATVPRAGPLAAPAGPAGLALALLGLMVGALHAAVPGHALCLPDQPGHLQPCGDAMLNISSRHLPAIEGPSTRRLAENLWPHPPEEEQEEDWSFGAFLGLSLPGAAGLLWGCSHPAELHDAARAVTAGSLGANLAAASGTDLAAALLLGGSVEGHLLRDKFGGSLGGSPVWGAVAWPWPAVALVAGGLSGGSAGLQALLGGARLLRALARTRTLPLPHALACGRLWPLAATALTAALGILLGSLDLVAPVLSVFCLTSHLGLNLVCALQGLLPTPGWAPRCRLYHWGLSLMGAALCLALMLLTCWSCALLALGIGATAYKYLEYRGAQSEWGEGLRGFFLSAARFALLRLEDGGTPAPSWRPQLLVLVKLDMELSVTQSQLLALAAQLQTGKGLTVLGSVLPGELPRDLPRAHAAESALRAALAAEGARGFVQVLVGPGGRGGGFPPGLEALVQGCGLGALRPNAVLLGWPRHRDPPAARAFVDLLRTVLATGRAVLVAKGPLDLGGTSGGTLDVWWGGGGDGRLLTLLPLLLRRHPAWHGSPLRLFAVRRLRQSPRGLRRLRAIAERRGLRARLVELHDGDDVVTDYTYERTLMMEQRAQMLRHMQRAKGGPAPSQVPSAAEEEEEEEEGGAPRQGPSPGNVRRMHTAERLNAAMGLHSGGARLVLLDLPPPRPPDTYLEFLEVLTEGLGPVLLVRGGDEDALVPESTSTEQYGPVQTSTTPT